MTFVDALRGALEERDPHLSQDRVHDVVARQLDELTPSSRVLKTDYYNHSWAPDLVVVTGDQPERRVFLRFDVRQPAFADDLKYLAADAPIFLDLAAANPSGTTVVSDETGAGRFDLAEALREPSDRDVLVTEAPAIEQFETLATETKDVRVATQQVVVGGRGLIDEEAARVISTRWLSASAAATEANADSLRPALDDLEAYLSRVASLDLETTLRARWIGAGQPAETFPGREDWTLTDRAPWEVARLVLSLVDSGDTVEKTRWREIAAAASLSDLGHELYRIGEYRESGAVNDLVTAGLPLWTAQYAYVPQLESDSLERFDWSFGDYSFALNLVSRRAYFTDIGKKWSRVPRANVLPDARNRITSLASEDVRGAGIVTTEENITETLRPTSSMSLAQRMEQILEQTADVAFRAARLTSLDVRVPGTNATASIDFYRSVVRTEVPVPVRSYALLCARFVTGLLPDEIAELEGRLDGLS